MDLTVEDEKPPPYVQYHSGDASVTFVAADQPPSQEPPDKARGCRCTKMKSLGVAVMLCLVTTVAALTLFFLQRADILPKAEHSKTAAAVDVTNLHLLGADNRFITIVWDRPQDNFDFYLLDVTIGNSYRTDALRKDHPGSCGNGTIISAQKTQVTCGPYEACSSVSVTVRTFSKGPPERTSTGTTLKDVFINGQDPGEPWNIAMVAKAPHTTRILWEPPASFDGTLGVYKVKVCKKSTTCDEKENLAGCVEREVSDAWMEFGSVEDTSYCVFVSASVRCGEKALAGPTASQEVRTPLFGLPDVSKLVVLAVKSGYVTLSWQRPKRRFDYYSVEVTEDQARSTRNSQQWHRLCANGTIIRPEQTEVTCGPFEPCTFLSCTVRTHYNGPPEHMSPGLTLKDIFIPAEDPNPPTNVTMIPESPLRSTLRWGPPDKVFGTIVSYSVNVCSTFRSCDPAEKMSDCVEQTTTKMWTVFDSKVDTSYCILIAATIRCGVDRITSRQMAAQVRTPIFDLPDVSNFRLLSAVDSSVTVAWRKPDARFDYYWVSVDGEVDQRSSGEKVTPGSCANGTILHPDMTQLTCTSLKACARVDITLGTHRNGPPEHTSRGVRLQGIFIPGEEPDPPKNITTVGKSSSLTRLQWEPPGKVPGRFLAYTVNICTTFESCGKEDKTSNCTELETCDTWLNFRSSVDTKYCIMVVTRSQCGEHVLRSRPAVAEMRTPLFDLPDVTNLDLVAADNHYLTVAWDQPRLSFDFYWLNVTGGFENGNDSLSLRTARACGNGTIIHPQQTQVTCGPFDSCSSVDVTIRTYNKGPHELMSKGTTLRDIFIGGEDPSEPRSINVVAESPTLSRLKWQAPARISGILDVYRVKVCEAFTTCDDNQNTSYCAEYETLDESLDINTAEDSLYCILITSNAWCGRNVLTSLPATLEFRTPLFKLPDVFNLTLVRVKMGYVTISWQRPKSRFDYYSVEVYENEDSGASAGHQWHRLCANGTIIRPDQTEMTCGPFQPCTNLSFTVRTYLNGPPQRRSPGATLTSIFIPAEDPIPATNVTMIPESPMRTRLQWGRPERETGIIESYSVKMCAQFNSCYPAEKLSDCEEQVTTEMWTLFDTKEDTSYCVLIAAKVRCGMDEISSRRVAAEIRTPLFDLPDVKDLTLLSAGDNTVTVAWKKPEARFDYYWVSVAAEKDGDNEMGTVGSCGNGTIIHPDQTQVTCTNLEACDRVNITLRAHRNGPPVHTSGGVRLQDIFIPGKEPDPPKNITSAGRSPTLTRLRWEPSAQVSGRFLEYTVKMCTTFKSCTREADMSDCAVVQTYDSWLDFHSRADTSYCVGVSASSQCGEHVLKGLPAVAEIRTPLFELSDVSNVTTGVEKGYIMLSWQRPQGRFDYYSVSVFVNASRIDSQDKLGLCANGTIIRSDQTKLACGPFKPCTKLSYTMRTHLKGPLEISSPGVTLTDIFIPAEEPYPPRNITMVPISSSRTQLHWDHPDKGNTVIHFFNVTICRTFTACAQAEYLRECKVHMAPERAITFDSTADTAYCVLVTAKTRCGMDEIISRTAAAEIRTPIFELAVVSNLMAKGIKNGFVTLSWQRPHGRFDYCSIEAFEDKAGNKSNDEHVLGRCANGTIIRPEQTQVTCGPFKPCTTLAFTVRTHLNGPPALISSGVTVEDIFIPGEEPLPPRNVKIIPVSSTLTLLEWEYPDNVTTAIDSYTVKICRTFRTCGPAGNLSFCEEHVTAQTWLNFNSTPDTPYCVLVSANTTCGIDKISSQPAVAESRTPIFEPHPPKDISISSVSPSVSRLQWDHPDKGTAVPLSYNVTICRTFRTCGRERNLGDCREEVTERMSVMFNSTQDTPYCILVTAKRRCGMDEIRGWPAVATLRTPVLVPPDVTNLRIVRVGADFFIAAWEKPKISFDYYSVEVTSTNRSKTGVAQDAVRSCVQGTIIHRDRTRIVCSQLPPCVYVRFMVQTHINKPTAGYSPGVTIKDIYIPGKVAVRNLTVSHLGDDNFTLNWQKPEGCVDNYTVMVTENSARSSGNASNGLVSCNKGGVITSSQTSVTCDQPELCANATISVKPNVRGAANDTLSGETLSGVFLPGKHPPPVRDLQLSAITHRYFEITYKAPKECYSNFDHYISRANSNSKARLSYCRVHKTSSRITATCNIKACGRVNIGAQTKSAGPSKRGSLWAELFGLNTYERCWPWTSI
ncbi:uncharacterized protein LOC119165286 isoform X2 [Rhipicephalus microplus]|uniref:uncharacterized protein LOC119165286 isoform X2 n=1 Tax=Rhipicephalus microplus TaxID=6941 RepID=UPI003F6C3ED5